MFFKVFLFDHFVCILKCVIFYGPMVKMAKHDQKRNIREAKLWKEKIRVCIKFKTRRQVSNVFCTYRTQLKFKTNENLNNALHTIK